MSTVLKNINALVSGLCLLTGGIIWGAQSARPHARDEYGMLPIHRTTLHGTDDELKQMLETPNVDVTAKLTNVGRATTRNVGPWPDAVAGQTALHLLANRQLGITSLKEFAELLIAKGADTNALDDRLQTPLHVAVYALPCDERTEVEELVKCLLVKGADANARDVNQDTPLHIATRAYDNATIIECLLQHGANINASNKSGETPLKAALTTLPQALNEQLASVTPAGGDFHDFKFENTATSDSTDASYSDEDVRSSDSCNSSSTLETNETD